LHSATFPDSRSVVLLPSVRDKANVLLSPRIAQDWHKQTPDLRLHRNILRNNFNFFPYSINKFLMIVKKGPLLFLSTEVH
jgi:hypothetical protein